MSARTLERPLNGVGGMLMTASPLPLTIVGINGDFLELPWLSQLLVGSNVIILFLSGLFLRGFNPRTGRLLALFGISGLLILLTPTLRTSPALALLSVTIAILLVHQLCTRTLWIRRSASAAASAAAGARGSGATFILLWLTLSLVSSPFDLEVFFTVALSFLAFLMSVLIWFLNCRRANGIRCLLIVTSLIGALFSIVFWWGEWWLVTNLVIVVPLTVLLVLPWKDRASASERFEGDWWGPILGHPERLLATTFLILCLAGTIWLALPMCSASGEGIHLVDAAFTAVSAVCVTGLIVLDTPNDFSLVGQAVILLLIQLGGLGIMTFSTVAMQLFGRRMSLRHETALAGLVSLQDRSKLFDAARTILLLTLAFEGIGAAILFFRFLQHGDSLTAALWRACFTAVSGFCNAGFALQSASLIPYQQDPWILHTVAGLIIAGGLSPLVILALPRLLTRSSHSISAQTRLVLSTTAALLVVGFLLVLTLEWSYSLRSFSFIDRLHNAWFQSVTLRTAGFNSVDFSSVRPVTLTVMIVFMFIGGSPGGTAGGIKTTTLAILLLSVVAAVRGRWMVVAFGRSIPHKSLYKAAAILTVGFSAVFLALLVAQTTQTMPGHVAIFEVVSALGTVGLSIGGTSMLDGVGKGLIIVCMFAGRIGPLTLFMFLSHRSRKTLWVKPQEEIDVG